MLTTLDDIDWKSRNAENVPVWIRQLASDNWMIRGKAQSELEENLLYAGLDFQDVDRGYGLSRILAKDTLLLVAPFLIELLGSDSIRTKDGIISILRFMTGFAEFKDGDEIHHQRARALREIIWNGLNTYLGLNEYEGTPVRMEASLLLCQFTEHKETVVPHILAALNAEGNYFCTIVLWEFHERFILSGKLSEIPSELIDLLNQFTGEDYISELRITASVCLIDILKENAPEHAAKIISRTMAKTPYGFPDIRIEAAGMHKYSQALVKLGIERGIPEALWVIQNTRVQRNAYFAMMSALILAFDAEKSLREYSIPLVFSLNDDAMNDMRIDVFQKYTPPFDSSGTITKLQKRVILALVENDFIWQATSNIFSIFGLPDNRDELRKIIRQRES